MKKLFLFLLFVIIPTIINAEENIIIRGDLFDQRADFSIFNGAMYDDYFNNSIVTSSLNSELKPTFFRYHYYFDDNAIPLYTDRWFNDYGYNPLQKIYELSDFIVSNPDYSNDFRQWAYKAMYLSIEAASKVVIETKASIGNDFYLLANNADYIYSLTRVEALLEKVSHDLELDSNAYADITSIDNSLTIIFNSYMNPEDKPTYVASSIIFPSIILPSDFQELKTLFSTLVDNDNNKQMINDNTTKFYLNIKKNYNIELRKNEDGMFEYNSNDFFIADNFGIGEDLDPNNETNYFWGVSPEIKHNYLFTYMFKLQINPETQGEFTFTGDDDVWVYLSEEDNPSNNFLVINLGGIHESQSSSFKFTEGENGFLNCIIKDRKASTYNEVPLRTDIDPNKKYILHLFFSERRPTGSNFRIVTNVAFTQSPKPLLENQEAIYNSPVSASLKLINEYNEETAFRLYDSFGNQVPDVLDNITNNNVNLIFNEPPSSNVTYYLTAQNQNETESDKVSFNINAYTEEDPEETNPPGGNEEEDPEETNPPGGNEEEDPEETNPPGGNEEEDPNENNTNGNIDADQNEGVPIDKNISDNPQTGDNILKYFYMFLLSFIVIYLLSKKIIKDID